MSMIFTGIYKNLEIVSSLVYLGDMELIRRLMSIMVLIYVIHTLFVVPYMAVSIIPQT